MGISTTFPSAGEFAGFVGWVGLVGLGVSRGSRHFRTKFAPNRCLATFVVDSGDGV